METEFFIAARYARIAWHRWQPAGQAAATVIIVHGLGEHGGRYDHLARFLAACGYRVWAQDLRGHGLSSGKRGYTGSYRLLLDDLNLLVGKASLEAPQTPLFIYGHSMGGGLVLNYTLKFPAGLTGAIVTGPLLRPTVPPPAGRLTLAKLLYRLYPSLVLPNGLDAAAISRDNLVVETYRNDPLVHDRLSVQLGLEMLAAGNWNLENAHVLSLPLLIMHGEDDRLTSCEASEEFARRAGASCRLKTWPGLYHEIHNEPEKEEIFAFLLTWLDETRQKAGVA